MATRHTVKTAFKHNFSNGGSVTVPAGARLEPTLHLGGWRWLDPSVFPAGSADRWDAEHYGVRVYLDNTEEL